VRPIAKVYWASKKLRELVEKLGKRRGGARGSGSLLKHGGAEGITGLL